MVLRENIDDVIYSAVRRYRGKLLFEDAVQEAWVAVLQAEKLFDPSKGTKFESYAYTAIMHALFTAKRKDTTVPIPQKSDATTSVHSLNATRRGRDDEDETYMELLVEPFDQEQFIEDRDLWTRIAPVLPEFARTLPEPLNEVFRLRFIEGREQSEVAKRTGFTQRGRMSHIEGHVLGLLKDHLVAHKCIEAE